MGHKQRAARRVALSVFLLSVLFPPWSYVIPGYSTQCFASYRFVLTPPPLKSPDEFRQIFYVYDFPGGNEIVVRIEYVRLVVEWLALLFLSAGAIQLLADNSTFPVLFAGAIGVLIGASLIVFLLLMPSCHAR